MNVLEGISQALIEGDIEEVRRLTEEALSQGLAAGEVLRNGLIAGMNVVGERFKKEEMFVPEVLVSAQAMHAGMDVLQPHLRAGEAASAGTLVLGTVEGDLHDIGKNLVGMMIEGAGYKVVDLGIDVPAEKFVAAVKEHEPDVLGMSALLTTTMPAMGEVIKALDEAGVRDKVKVIVGGAPLTQEFADKIEADGYAPDAMSAVDLVRHLTA
jgi:corrinoid protein of di/trimethylamine methyltransferase